VYFPDPFPTAPPGCTRTPDPTATRTFSANFYAVVLGMENCPVPNASSLRGRVAPSRGAVGWFFSYFALVGIGTWGSDTVLFLVAFIGPFDTRRGVP